MGTKESCAVITESFKRTLLSTCGTLQRHLDSAKSSDAVYWCKWPCKCKLQLHLFNSKT